jgi:hypothetical protein
MIANLQLCSELYRRITLIRWQTGILQLIRPFCPSAAVPLFENALVVHHHDALVHSIGHFLQACVSGALSIVVHHILLVLEERGDGESVALGALVGERFACLDVQDIRRAILEASLATR